MLHAVLRLIAVFCVSFVSVWPLADLQQRATGALGEWLRRPRDASMFDP
jgi:hypothetical protein